MSVLPFVRGVDFSRNEFRRDQFVDKMAEMKNLRWLRLNRSQLGSLPDEIDQFQKLEVLALTHNKMTALHSGNLPALSSLRVVNVAHNNIRDSGLPSELFTLKELHTLDMSHNNLSKIPDELLKAKNLIVVDLSHNKISSIPGALFIQLTGVEYLNLSHNELQSLPPQLRRMEHMKHLNLARNPLQHYAFKVLDKLTNLTALNLSATGRDFTNLPHIDKLVNLTDIDLSCNDLSRIPESVYLVESLTRVNMSHNCIKELSSLIDTWHILVTLDLSSNQITALHPNICKCSKLRRLFLSDNRLNFEGIPPAIGKLTSLEHFVAGRNRLECVPEGLCHCYSLKSLILTSNCLLTLPEAIHFLKLEKLDIRDNPDLTMPPKPVQQVKGSGAEWYHIDFDPEILKKGAVVSSAQVIKGTYTKQKERREKMQKSRRMSVSTLRASARDAKEKDAAKVLKGLIDVAEATAGERDNDVLAAGSGVSMATDRDRERAPEKQKRWDALLKRPDLDYSDLFTDMTGKLPGLTVWQIENFYPIELDEAQHGQFYKGDCYIVLKTEWNEMSELTWDIYFWIGDDATMDKKACAAMHAVHLRNMLGSDRRTHRQEMGDEDDAFIELFTDITYIEGGSQSGFYTVDEEDVVYRLYQLHGNKQPFLEPVETVAESLDLGQVFLLDCGDSLFIWCGTQSSLMARSKTRLLAEKINKFERKNRSSIYQLRPGLEPEEFWDYLGGEPENPIPQREDVYVPRRPILYRVGLGTGYLELPQVEVPLGRLRRDILKTNDVCIMDCYTDIFVWIGRKSARLVRAAALRLADELQKMLERPSSALVTRCQEGSEPVVFKTRFSGWEDIMSVDFTRTAEMMEKRAVALKKNPGQDPDKKAAKVDMSPLFLERQPPMANRDANEIQFQYNRQLVSMRCCIIEGRKFSILPNKEKGHFYSAECYFFLCRYLEEKERDVDSGEEGEGAEGEGEEDEEEEEEIQTVVYFWQGRDASKMGWLHFTLGIQKQLEQAIEGPIDVIHLKQQQEDFRFLSHFGGKFIIHWGKRNPEVKNYQPSLYQIRANQSKLCRRVVQLPATPRSLNSAFCHILKVPFETGGTGIVYIWIGSQATQEEAIHAEQMGRSMFDSTYSNVLVQEGSEPENFFWVALGGKKEYETNADFMKRSRLFRCSNEKGFFAVSEKCSDFCQGDMSNQDVMLLDTGKEVFIWFGADATDIEKKLSVKATQVYIKHLEEQGKGGKRKLKLAKRGAEPWDFTRCFHGWVTEGDMDHIMTA